MLGARKFKFKKGKKYVEVINQLQIDNFTCDKLLTWPLYVKEQIKQIREKGNL